MNFMKEKINIFCIVITGLLVSYNAAAQPSDCSAAPYAITVEQPDGSEIAIIGKGSNNEHYTETTDGYTLKRNSDGFYEYAILNEEGQLKPSGVQAKNPEDRPSGKKDGLSDLDVEKGLRPVAPEDPMQKFLPQEDAPWNKHDHDEPHQSFPSTGEHNVLLLLIEYPDLPRQYTIEDFFNLMNEENYNGTGSFRDYYLENSNGQLDLSIDVEGWYMAENGYEYYGRDNGSHRTRDLVGEAIDHAHDEGVDFSKYDNNGDGEVDGILVVHSGPGAEEGSQTEYIWSHRWHLGNQARYYDNVQISEYGVQPETRNNGNRMVGIGIFTHEFGHILGLPDLYDTDNNTSGIGQWGVMGSGGWLDNEHSPSHFTPWSKMDLQWQEANILNENQYVELDPVSTSHEFYKIPIDDHEYFLVENRQNVGFDRALPGRGLAIWHIDGYIISDYRSSNSINTDPSSYGVRLIQADGRQQLENNQGRGNAGDLYPGLTGNTEFSHFSSPPAETIYGDDAGFSIFNIEENDQEQVTFNFEMVPVAQFSLDRELICAGSEISTRNNTMHFNDQEWDFGDGTISTEKEPVHTYDEPGEYTITLKAEDSKGNTDEMQKTVSVIAYPVADFDFNIEDGGKVNVENLSSHSKDARWYYNDQIVNPNQIKYEQGKASTLTLVAGPDRHCRDTIEKQLYHQVEEEQFSSIFPNPAGNELNIAFEELDIEKNQVTIRFYDQTGKKIKSYSDHQDIWYSNNPEILSIDVSEFNNGVYMLEIIKDDDRKVKRFVKYSE